MLALPLLVLAARDSAETRFGPGLVAIALVLALSIHLVFYSRLYRIASSSEQQGSPLIPFQIRGMMGMLAIIAAIIVVFGANRIVLHLRPEIMGKVSDRQLCRSRGADCRLLEIGGHSRHCVDPHCWNLATTGKRVALAPKTGIPGAKMLDATCKASA